MNSILIHPQSKEEEEIFEKLANALKVPYEIKKDNPYKKEFVEMVKEADIEYQTGKGKMINLDDICK